MVCSPSMAFQDCELAILRLNVDKVEKEQGKLLVESPETKKTIRIVESFIKSKKLEGNLYSCLILLYNTPMLLLSVL